MPADTFSNSEISDVDSGVDQPSGSKPVAHAKAPSAATAKPSAATAKAMAAAAATAEESPVEEAPLWLQQAEATLRKGRPRDSTEKMESGGRASSIDGVDATVNNHGGCVWTDACSNPLTTVATLELLKRHAGTDMYATGTYCPWTRARPAFGCMGSSSTGP